jgi:hypothetical protein
MLRIELIQPSQVYWHTGCGALSECQWLPYIIEQRISLIAPSNTRETDSRKVLQSARKKLSSWLFGEQVRSGIKDLCLIVPSGTRRIDSPTDTAICNKRFNLNQGFLLLSLWDLHTSWGSRDFRNICPVASHSSLLPLSWGYKGGVWLESTYITRFCRDMWQVLGWCGTC